MNVAMERAQTACEAWHALGTYVYNGHNPGQARAWSGLGLACSGLGDMHAAMEAFSKSLELRQFLFPEPFWEAYCVNKELDSTRKNLAVRAYQYYIVGMLSMCMC